MGRRIQTMSLEMMELFLKNESRISYPLDDSLDWKIVDVIRDTNDRVRKTVTLVLESDDWLEDIEGCEPVRLYPPIP